MGQDKEIADSLNKLQYDLGIRFNDITLLIEAMAHRSYLNENPNISLQSNERLEFLGDAIIGFIITERLFREFPSMSEGEMTKLRSQVVSEKGLSTLARQIDLGKYLLLSKGEHLTGGRDRDSNLARTFESLVGAIYLDLGISVVMGFLSDRITKQEILELTASETFDSKSKLQEYAQARFQLTPVYETVREEGPPHDRNFIVEVRIGDRTIGRGQGKSKKKAEEIAAKYALDTIKNN